MMLAYWNISHPYQTTCPASSSNDTHTGHCSTSIVDSMAGHEFFARRGAQHLLLRRCILSPKPTRWWNSVMSFWKNLKTPTFLTWELPHMTQKCHDASQSLDIYKIQLTPLWHPDYPRTFASQCTNMATLQKQCWCNLSQQWKRKLTFSTTFGCDGTLFVPGVLPNTPISRGR